MRAKLILKFELVSDKIRCETFLARNSIFAIEEIPETRTIELPAKLERMSGEGRWPKNEVLIFNCDLEKILPALTYFVTQNREINLEMVI